MLLLHDVIQVFHLAQGFGRGQIALLLEFVEGLGISGVLIDGETRGRVVWEACRTLRKTRVAAWASGLALSMHSNVRSPDLGILGFSGFSGFSGF